MPQLIFRCPYTNKPIVSGIELVSANLKAVSDYPISVDCPHCNSRHHGFIADGCLVDDRSPSPSSPEP